MWSQSVHFSLLSLKLPHTLWATSIAWPVDAAILLLKGSLKPPIPLVFRDRDTLMDSTVFELCSLLDVQHPFT